MTGAFGSHGSGTARIPPEHLAELGLRDDHVVVTQAGIPDRLLESHLEAWSYTPDFTGLVQALLEHLQTERNLSIAICGSPADSRARSHAALQLSIGLTQHGRSVAVVDADATLPGLAGLITDPHAEGLIDMVRFGRSCRSLLWKPLQTGPAVLPLGSFPLRGRLPFDSDAVRGVLHRVALHTDVALYVAPIVEGQELHPIVHACGHVVHVQGPESVTRGLDPDLVAWVTRGSVRVLGLVFHDTVDAAASGAASTSVSSTPNATASPAASELLTSDAQPWSDPLAAPPVGSEPPPKFDLDDLEPALNALEPQGEEPTLSPTEPFSRRGGRDGEKADATPRTPDEAREVREMLRLGETEFAYDEKTSYSRTPLYLLITLVVLIGGFLGWVLWTERGIEERQQPTVRNQPAVETPESNTAAEGPGAETPGTAATTGVDDAAGAPSQSDATGGADAAAGTTQDMAEAALRQSPPPATTGGEVAAQQPAPGGPGASTSTPPPDTPSPTAGTQSSPPSGVSYGVHVASYQQAGRAKTDVDNLRKHGFEARAIRTDLGSKGIWYRVYVGSYPSRAAASRAREAVLKLPEYSFAQVRRVPSP